MKIYLILGALLATAQTADAVTVTYTFSGRIPSSISSEVGSQEISPELSALVGRKFSYTATVDPDAPVDLGSGQTFGFSGPTKVDLGNEVFEQDSSQAVSKTGITAGAGSSFFGITALEGSPLSPFLSDFDLVFADFEFFQLENVPASPELPSLSDFDMFDNAFFSIVAFLNGGQIDGDLSASELDGGLFEATALIDTITLNGETRSFEQPDLTPSFDGATIPLPASLPLLVFGLAGLWSIGRFRTG